MQVSEKREEPIRGTNFMAKLKSKQAKSSFNKNSFLSLQLVKKKTKLTAFRKRLKKWSGREEVIIHATIKALIH
jgi:hypothetical protein